MPARDPKDPNDPYPEPFRMKWGTEASAAEPPLWQRHVKELVDLAREKPHLETTAEEAPAHYSADEANAWACGYDAGVIEAVAACANVAEAHGGADGLVISTKIANILMNHADRS